MPSFLFTLTLMLAPTFVFANFTGNWIAAPVQARGVVCNDSKITISLSAKEIDINQYTLRCGEFSFENAGMAFDRVGNDVFHDGEKIGTLNIATGFDIQFVGKLDGSEFTIIYTAKMNADGTIGYNEKYIVDDEVLLDIYMNLKRK